MRQADDRFIARHVQAALVSLKMVPDSWLPLPGTELSREELDGLAEEFRRAYISLGYGQEGDHRLFFRVRDELLRETLRQRGVVCPPRFLITDLVDDDQAIDSPS